jgi:hypothetical protein
MTILGQILRRSERRETAIYFDGNGRTDVAFPAPPGIWMVSADGTGHQPQRQYGRGPDRTR